MMIRKEEPKDYETIYSVVKDAFESAEHADGNEQDLVDALRKGEAFIPDLSLVAEIDGKIVGHIMFTRAAVGGDTVLALAPLSVLPEYQRKGIGISLIKAGHKIASELGYGYSVVLGSQRYYPKAGYLTADKFGIKPSFDVPNENFMACKIKENAPDIHGIIKYAKEFGIENFRSNVGTMDISFRVDDAKFNYRVCAMIITDGKILAMRDERSPYFYLPGGRVKMGETAENAVVREVREELGITPRIDRPLWLNQAYFKEDVDNLNYHELCIYFLMDISHTSLLSKGERFTMQEGQHRHSFEWLAFERLKDEYFYPIFLKESIFNLPSVFTIRTEAESSD